MSVRKVFPISAGVSLLVNLFGFFAQTQFVIFHRRPGSSVFRPTGPSIMLANNSHSIRFQIPFKFDDKEDIEIRAIGEITAGIGAASWEGWYE